MTSSGKMQQNEGSRGPERSRDLEENKTGNQGDWKSRKVRKRQSKLLASAQCTLAQKINILMLGAAVAVIGMLTMFFVARLSEENSNVTVLRHGRPGQPQAKNDATYAWKWDVVTVAMPPARRRLHSTEFSEFAEESQKHLTEHLRLRASADIYVLGYELGFSRKRPDEIPMVRHLRAWEIGFMVERNINAFMVLDGEFDMELAALWDGTLSELVEKAHVENPDWDILALTTERVPLPAAWECGLRFQNASKENNMESMDLKAYIVADNHKTRAWFAPFRERRNHRLMASTYGDRSNGAVKEILSRTFRVYQTTFPVLLSITQSITGPQTSSHDVREITSLPVREYWRPRSRRPCESTTVTSPRPNSVIRQFRPEEQPAKNATHVWKWDMVTVAMPPIQSRQEHEIAKEARKQMTDYVLDLRASADIYILDEVPDPDPLASALLPDNLQFELSFISQKRPAVIPLLRHLRAWEIGFMAERNINAFMVLDGEFDMELAALWDGPLSELVEKAHADIPDWDILALTTTERVPLPAAWECGLRFQLPSSFTGDTPNLKAYIVADNHKTRAWFAPFREWRHRRLSTDGFVAHLKFDHLNVKQLLRRTFRVYQTTFPMLKSPTAKSTGTGPTTPSVTSLDVREFWQRRSTRPCERTPRPRRDQRDLSHEDPSLVDEPCQLTWHGHLPPLEPATPTLGSCGERWDVPGLYVNLDEARTRRARMEETRERLRPAARLERSAAVNASSSLMVRELMKHREQLELERSDRGPMLVNEVEVAALLAHFAALERGVREFGGKSSVFLVMEDDVDFSTIPHWDVKLSEFLKLASDEAPDWEFLNLAPSSWSMFAAWAHCRLSVQPFEFYTFEGNSNWPPGYSVPRMFGLVLYAVRIGPALDKLLTPYRRFMSGEIEASAFVRESLMEPADWLLYRKLTAYVAYAPLVAPSLLRSQIKPGRESSHEARAQLVREYWHGRPKQCALPGHESEVAERSGMSPPPFLQVEDKDSRETDASDGNLKLE